MNCTRCPRDRTRITDSSRPVQNIVVVVNVVVPVVTEVEVEIVVAVRAAAVTVLQQHCDTAVVYSLHLTTSQEG